MLSLSKSEKKVLELLKSQASIGLSVTDELLPRGFALRSRISDLRHKGYIIHSQAQKDTPVHRYWLIPKYRYWLLNDLLMDEVA